MQIFIRILLCLFLWPHHSDAMLRFQNDKCIVLGDYPAHTIKIKDLVTDSIIDLEAVKMPIAMAEKDNFLYILGFQSFTVAVVDLGCYTLVRTYSTEKSPLELTLSETHALVNRNELFPLFPIKKQFDKMFKQGLLAQYTVDQEYMLAQPAFEKPKTLPEEFKQLINDLRGSARLVKEEILDLLPTETALMVIILLDEPTYLTSGEWTFRRKKILNRLCICMTLFNRGRAQNLIRLMKTAGDNLSELTLSKPVMQPSVQGVLPEGVDDDGDQPNV